MVAGRTVNAITNGIARLRTSTVVSLDHGSETRLCDGIDGGAAWDQNVERTPYVQEVGQRTRYF